ncbi:hypothetical protein P3X46_007563 [Hevea brasiliensis]|uniref:SHSP domain-containing protein n=1 Tax=Hevea brasiliensis TaxID=3981 RepID=A0ABQ9MU15_HEVBR|nr:inactive protein RESTRICTED TEV MOVEMENT 2 [Hevea brasiliensis]KAJ9183751.1 hypothetical protein P3X46_007563 [Hevea brasiliensis]
MAARTPTGGLTAIQYEDFKPKSEFKEEEGANILLLHLPADFHKEQIKIKYVRSSSSIRVVGERPISGNKWSRFNEAFPVSQNCDVQTIQAKLLNGVLTITMPKPTIEQPPIPQKPISTSTGNEGKDKTLTPLEARTEEKMKKQTDGKFEQKPNEDFFAEKVKDVKNAAAAAKKIVMELKEERQSLVNIGVAVLVIAALGTYIYYTFGSSRNSKD